MAKSNNGYDIIYFTLSDVVVGFRDLTVEIQPSRKLDSRKGTFATLRTPVKLRYGTVRGRAVPEICCTVPYDYSYGKCIM